jgi:D-alanyl-D-alanine carboxypeptidase
MKPKIILLALLCVTASMVSCAQTLNQKKLDSFLNILDKNQQAMGCVSITQKGKLIFTRAIGFEQINEKQKIVATPKTRYRIGSISKMITAIMIFQLIEEGKLSLETPLAKFYPQVPNSENVQIGHILNHQSGLGEIQQKPDFFTSFIYQPRTEADLLDVIVKAPNQFKPLERTVYNNSGPILLSLILQKIEGKPYKEILQARIVNRLKLPDTFYDPKPTSRPNESRSYQWKNGWQLLPETDMSVPIGAGGIVSTTQDINLVMEALFAGKLVKASTLEIMKKTTNGIGKGIFELKYGGQTGYGHKGDIDGYSSLSIYFPDAKTTISYFTNGKLYPKEDVFKGIANITFNQTFEIPDFSPKERKVSFKLDMKSELPLVKDKSSIGVRGDTPPLAWDKSLTMDDLDGDGVFEKTVTLTTTEPHQIQYKYHYDQNWEKIPNRTPRLSAQNTFTDRWNLDAGTQQLYNEVLKQDSLFFTAYNNQDIQVIKNMMADDVEFFHDRAGFYNYQQNIQAFQSQWAGGTKPVRKLLKESVEIKPIRKWGALQTGLHEFCTTTNGQTSCQTFKFVHLWSYNNNIWKLSKIVSYGH